MRNVFLWLISFFVLLLPTLLVILLYISYRRRVRLRKERDSLLMEKEAVLGFVQNVGEVFADTETIDLDALLARVLHYAVRTCKANSGCIHLLNTRTNTLEARAISGVFPPPFETDFTDFSLRGNASEQLEQIVRETLLTPGEGLIGETAVLGNATLVEDAEMDSRVPQLPIPFLKIKTLLIVPMRFGNHTIGVMTLVNRVNGGHFALTDLNLAQALAAQSSVPVHYAGLQETLEEKRQIDRDMHMARQIQSSLLPGSLPSYPTVDLAAFSQPALDIGGDYYDVIEIDDRHIGLAIADVSGKGIGGALMMAVCRSVLRVNARNVYDPSSMLTSLNETLSSNLPEDMFVSMLYMVLNLDTHLLSYARAGHEAPLILRRGAVEMEQVETAGIAIGLVDTETFGSIIQTRNVSLKPNDLVVTYTDGITEAMSSDEEEWGIDRLWRAVEKGAQRPVEKLLTDIRAEVTTFTGNNRQYDDMTMLALKIVGENAEPPHA